MTIYIRTRKGTVRRGDLVVTTEFQPIDPRRLPSVLVDDPNIEIRERLPAAKRSFETAAPPQDERPADAPTDEVEAPPEAESGATDTTEEGAAAPGRMPFAPTDETKEETESAPAPRRRRSGN